MSTRWYPLYQKGNPQLRIFLPNFWLKLVSPEVPQPKNIVVFHCSMEMTKFDVQNYLEKIYNVFPVKVHTRIALGKTRKCPKQRCVIKDDDIKIAYAVLPSTETFTFPDLFPPSDDKSIAEKYKKEELVDKQLVKTNKVPGLPTWFRI